jgi:hypothetical protein
MLLELHGDFALQTRMEGEWEEREELGQGGLLVWKDVLNYVRFDKFVRGSYHHGDVRLEGRVAGEYLTFGRGQLRGNSYHLRLERTEDRFAALCSTNGVDWVTCGHVRFPVRDPVLAGVWAGHGIPVQFDYVWVLGR